MKSFITFYGSVGHAATPTVGGLASTVVVGGLQPISPKPFLNTLHLPSHLISDGSSDIISDSTSDLLSKGFTNLLS